MRKAHITAKHAGTFNLFGVTYVACDIVILGMPIMTGVVAMRPGIGQLKLTERRSGREISLRPVNAERIRRAILVPPFA